MKIAVLHSKRLASTQFDAMKGSEAHARMTMNRVWIQAKPEAGSNSPNYQIRQQWKTTDCWLAENCKDYYFVADRRPSDEYRVYFLSRDEMEEFIVWVRLALPKALDKASDG